MSLTRNSCQQRRWVPLKPLLLMLSSGLLAACGGGTGESAAPISATGTASTDQKLKALAVPPGWVGRVPKPEVINGISVPPEPDPIVNNSTLAGVDSNKNGVRDDVERIIARKVSGIAGFNRALVVARAYQRLLASATVSQADSDASMLEVECFVYRNLTDPVGIKSAEIKNTVFNTPERLEDLRKKALYLTPRITDTKHECA